MPIFIELQLHFFSLSFDSKDNNSFSDSLEQIAHFGKLTSQGETLELLYQDSDVGGLPIGKPCHADLEHLLLCFSIHSRQPGSSGALQPDFASSLIAIGNSTTEGIVNLSKFRPR
ncbi:MAG: hypothetical protein Q7R95_06495 [bacterium]|nr:hypothetical protein [bacterium]